MCVYIYIIVNVSEIHTDITDIIIFFYLIGIYCDVLVAALHFIRLISVLGAGERMPRGAAERGKISPFSPAADYTRETSESQEKSDTEEEAAKGEERKKSEQKEPARSRRSRNRSRNAKRGRDPSYSYNKRRHRREQRRTEGHGHRRRRREHKSVDKRRRSESADDKRAALAKQVSKSVAARPRSPAWEPGKPRTRPCSHCGYEITTQQSGRLQHQWASRNCLTWQFWNQLEEDIKKNKPKAGWDKARKAAFALYERRRMQAAPYQAEGELAPPPALLLRSRTSVARSTAESLEEMEEIPLEEEPVRRPTRPSRSQSAAPATMVPSGEQVPAPLAAATVALLLLRFLLAVRLPKVLVWHRNNRLSSTSTAPETWMRADQTTEQATGEKKREGCGYGCVSSGLISFTPHIS